MNVLMCTMTDLNAGAARYLRYVLKQLDVSPTALARLAKISSTTLTRFLNDPSYKFTISTTTISKIYQATKINPAPFMDVKSQADIAQLAYFEDHKIYGAEEEKDAEDWEPSEVTVVVGEVAAGLWREMEVVDIFEHAPLQVKLAFYRTKDCFAMIVRGESLNKIARDGDYLLCVRRDAMRHSIASGDLVIVQRTRESGRIIEVTAKRVKQVDASYELWPVSDDPRFKAAIPIDTLDDTLEASFLGVVELIVRAPHNA